MTLTYRGEYRKYLRKQSAPEVKLIQEWLVEHLDAFTDLKRGTPVQQFNLLPHCTEASNAAGSLQHWSRIFDAAGHKLHITNTGCCGMAGTYGHEKRNVQTSKRIYALSWKKIIDSNTQHEFTIASGYSCRSQVKRESEVLLAHPVQVLLKLLQQE